MAEVKSLGLIQGTVAGCRVWLSYSAFLMVIVHVVPINYTGCNTELRSASRELGVPIKPRQE